MKIEKKKNEKKMMAILERGMKRKKSWAQRIFFPQKALWLDWTWKHFREYNFSGEEIAEKFLGESGFDTKRNCCAK